MFSNILEDLKCYCVCRGYGDSPTLIQQIITIFSSRGFWAVAHHRFGFWVGSLSSTYRNPIKLFFKIIYFLGKYLIVCTSKIDILSIVDAGPGLYLSNKGNIILGAHKIGSGCRFQFNITVGQGVDTYEVPVFGDNIVVGHDSLIFGSITVGSDVKIGPRTVLSRSLPDGVSVKGYPCRVTDDLEEIPCV